TIVDEDLSNRVGCGDETIDLPVLPPRERIALEMKVDAAGGDEGRRAAACDRSGAERQRQRRQRHPVRIVRMDEIRREPLHELAEPPGGREIQLGARRERDYVERVPGAAPDLAVRMHDERRAVADRVQAVHRQQYLVLTASPGP